MYKKFLDPTTDLTFKRVFGDEKRKDILISFLNAVTDRKNGDRIVDVQVRDPYNYPQTNDLKLSIVDLRCKDQRGNNYIVEIQVAKQENYKKRCQFYTCNEVVRQLPRSGAYGELAPVIFIGITYFDMLRTRNYVSHHKTLDTQSYEWELQLTEYHFIELSKFSKEVNELNSIVDKWIYFLKNAEGLLTVPDELQENSAIVHAFDVLEIANYSKEELEAYDRMVDLERVEIDVIQTATRVGIEKGLAEGIEKGLAEGIEKGLAEGIEKGKAEGIEKGKVEAQKAIAKNLLRHLSIEEVSKVTGLKIEELKKL